MAWLLLVPWIYAADPSQLLMVVPVNQGTLSGTKVPLDPQAWVLMEVRVAKGDGRIRISVMDNGVGISPENLTRIFSHGFTTRKGGHGFGLHSGALAAREMGGSLTAHSDGPGRGATFTLELPWTGPGELP